MPHWGRHGWGQDDGIATPVEMMYLLVFCLVAVLFIGYVGRLHAAGVEVTNAAQSAARAASLAPDPVSAERAAVAAAQTTQLGRRCRDGAQVTVHTTRSSTGTWQGGSVVVTVTCTIRTQELVGVWVPGWRTVVVTDQQPVDRYRR
jgi:Flp pilus assembly protein TadG